MSEHACLFINVSDSGPAVCDGCGRSQDTPTTPAQLLTPDGLRDAADTIGRILDLSKLQYAELVEERRLSAEKDAKLAAMTAAWADRASKLADTERGIEANARITERMLAKLTQQQAVYELELTRYASRLAEQSATLARLEQELGGWKWNANHGNECIARLAEESRVKTRLIEQQAQEIATLKAERDEAASVLRNVPEDTLVRKVKRTKGELDAAIGEVGVETAARCDLQDELAALRAQVETLTADISTIQVEHAATVESWDRAHLLHEQAEQRIERLTEAVQLLSAFAKWYDMTPDIKAELKRLLAPDATTETT